MLCTVLLEAFVLKLPECSGNRICTLADSRIINRQYEKTGRKGGKRCGLSDNQTVLRRDWLHMMQLRVKHYYYSIYYFYLLVLVVLFFFMVLLFYNRADCN
jgi:hypothetical protein